MWSTEQKEYYLIIITTSEINISNKFHRFMKNQDIDLIQKKS